MKFILLLLLLLILPNRSAEPQKLSCFFLSLGPAPRLTIIIECKQANRFRRLLLPQEQYLPPGPEARKHTARRVGRSKGRGEIQIYLIFLPVFEKKASFCHFHMAFEVLEGQKCPIQGKMRRFLLERGEIKQPPTP